MTQVKWHLSWLKKTQAFFSSLELVDSCRQPYLPEGVREGHDGVADELELRLELRVGGGEALPARAPPRVVPVVGRRQAARVAALEVVLPELCCGLDGIQWLPMITATVTGTAPSRSCRHAPIGGIHVQGVPGKMAEGLVQDSLEKCVLLSISDLANLYLG